MTTSQALPARRSRAPWVAAAGVILAVALIGGAVYLGSRGGDSPSTSAGSPPSSGSSHSSSTPVANQKAAMRSFITDYLSKVTSDQHASWAELTPSFQAASGGFGHYQQFWRAFARRRHATSSATPGR